MTGNEWRKIGKAATLLGLGERATLREIKKSYRRMARKHHPDVTAGGRAGGSGKDIAMHEITEAYEVLLAYCRGYSFPLTPDRNEPSDPEDWWMERFGHDPLWGRKKD